MRLACDAEDSAAVECSHAVFNGPGAGGRGFALNAKTHSQPMYSFNIDKEHVHCRNDQEK